LCLQGELVSRLYSDGGCVDELTAEDPDTAEARMHLHATRKAYLDAMAILNEVKLL
jgi:hypothetical protein